ncbi:MAG: hypothetical protein K1X83_11995 [Oligoflexia bacterium]|nr:hypothetical protein [Oligoflexia bacterium]
MDLSSLSFFGRKRPPPSEAELNALNTAFNYLVEGDSRGSLSHPLRNLINQRHRGRVFCAGALSRILDIDPLEFAAPLALITSQLEWDLLVAFKSLGDRKADHDQIFTTIKSGLARYERTVKDFYDSEAGQRFVKYQPGKSSTQALLDCGAKVLPNKAVEGQDFLGFCFGELQPLMRSSSGPFFGNAEQLVTDLEALHERAGTGLLRHYLEEHRAELAALVGLPTQSPVNDSKALMTVTLLWTPHGNTATERLTELLQAYFQIGENDGYDLYREAQNRFGSRREAALEAADRAVQIASTGEYAPTVKVLLSAVQGSRRGEFLDALTEDHRLYELYRPLRRSGLTVDEWVDFVLDGRDLPLPTGSQLIDLVTELSQNAFSVPAANWILRNGHGVLYGPDGNEILELLRSYSNAENLLTHYARAVEERRPSRARALVRLGQAGPDSAKLKNARLALASLSESDTEELLRAYPTPELFLRRMLRNDSLVAREAAAKEKIAVPLPLQQVIFSQLPAEIKPRAEHALSLLPEDVQHRFTRAFRRGLPCLTRLIEDVYVLSDFSEFLDVLRDDRLFRAYLTGLADPKFSLPQLISEVHTNPTANKHAMLCMKLLPVRERKLFAGALEAPPPEISENVISARRYKRVIIWGGEYQGPKRSELAQANPGVTLVIADIFEEFSFGGKLDQDDLVIFNTTAGSHSNYFNFKERAKKAGAGIYHVMRSGYEPMLELLRRVQPQ